jgi:hypothetical protein
VSDLPSVPDYFGQFMAPLQRQQQIDINRQQVQAEEAQVYQRAAEQQAKLHQQQMFQSDAQSVISNPTPEGYRSLMLKYPSEHEGIKAAWDQQSEGQRQRDTEAASQVYAALSNGRSDLALSLLKDRQAALKNGGEDDKVTDNIIDMISSGDPAKVKQAQGIAGFVLANAAGPDKIGSTLEALSGSKGGFTLDPGAIRYDANGNVVAESPYLQGKDGTLYQKDNGSVGGAPSAPSGAGPSSTSPAASSTASALASAGLPAPVVAGFMGNFHIEGGYNGAKGDGGSASGIAQWHNDRAANFQKVIGKPVAEASPAEQARFVAWEMQNPKAAGMTVAQRDAILAAKTPASAAALIDQYYERSSGKDRRARMLAASAFASDATAGPSAAASTAPSAPPGYRVLIPAGPGSPPSGYEADPSKPGALRPIPGGPADKGTSAAPPGNPDLSGPDYLSDLRKQNPSLAAQVQGVLDTRLAYPPATARSPQAQQLRAAVLQTDPGYDEQAYARRKTTVQQYTPGHAGPGQSMLSAATLINHMYDLAKAARDLPDHSTKAQNALSSWWGSETNAPWLITFNEGRKFVSSELPKFLNGKAPTEGEQRDHYESYSPSKGKTGIQNALATDVDYLYGRYQPLIQAYKDSTGKDLNIDSYAPGQATAAKAAALEYYRANGALPVVVTSPAQAAKLPHGSVFVTPDGRVLTRH